VPPASIIKTPSSETDTSDGPAQEFEYLREMPPDRRRVSVVQLGVRLHFSKFCDTPLGHEWIDICGREPELESHNLLPVFGPDVFDDTGIQVFHEMNAELATLFENE
jgi:hypothetical protein